MTDTMIVLGSTLTSIARTTEHSWQVISKYAHAQRSEPRPSAHFSCRVRVVTPHSQNMMCTTAVGREKYPQVCSVLTCEAEVVQSCSAYVEMAGRSAQTTHQQLSVQQGIVRQSSANTHYARPTCIMRGSSTCFAAWLAAYLPSDWDVCITAMGRIPHTIHMRCCRIGTVGGSVQNHVSTHATTTQAQWVAGVWPFLHWCLVYNARHAL